MRLLQLGQRTLDRGLLVGGELVAILFELLLRGKDVRVGGVDLVDTLLLLLVLGLVGLGLIAHTLDFLLGKARRSLDTDLLLLARALVLGRDVQNTVGVDIERHLDLRHTARSGRNAVQVEAADRLVVAGQRTFALADVDLDRRLVIGSRGEGLRLAGRDRGVGVDELGHHTAQGLDTQRQRRNVEQQHVLHLAREHTALDSGAYGHHFVGVHALVGRAAEELLDDLLDRGDTGRTADEDHLVDLRSVEARVAQSEFARLDGLADQVVAQLLELGTRERHNEVLRNAVDGHDVRQVDLRGGRGRKFDLRLLGSFLQTLQGHRILAQVDLVLGLERLGHVVDQHVVEVVAAQVGIAVGRLHFEDAVAQLEDRNIERTAAEVIHGDLHIAALLVHTVGQCGCGRLVDDTAHLQPGDLASLLRSLALRVGEIGGNRDDSLRNLLSEVVFGRFLHLLQDDGRNLLRRILAAVDIDARGVVVTLDDRIGGTLYIGRNLIVALAHETLDRKDRTFGVGDGLTLSRVTHLALAVRRESHHRRGRAVSLGVGNNHGLVALHHCYAGVRST